MKHGNRIAAILMLVTGGTAHASETIKYVYDAPAG